MQDCSKSQAGTRWLQVFAGAGRLHGFVPWPRSLLPVGAELQLLPLVILQRGCGEQHVPASMR